MCLLYREKQMDSIALQLFKETHPARCIQCAFCHFNKEIDIKTYILPVSGKSSLTIKHTETIRNNWGLLPAIRDPK